MIGGLIGIRSADEVAKTAFWFHINGVARPNDHSKIHELDAKTNVFDKVKRGVHHGNRISIS